ncbi:MAG: hypothetical protein AAF568_06185, partial [Pseudomonadota bacterium]
HGTLVTGQALGEGFAEAKGVWNDGAAITVAAKSVPREGALAVCGIWILEDGSALTSSLHPRIVEAGAIRAGGETLVQNLGFLRRQPVGTDPATAQASCVTTDRAWDPAFEAVEISLPRQVFGGGIGSDEVRLSFRQISER